MKKLDTEKLSIEEISKIIKNAPPVEDLGYIGGCPVTKVGDIIYIDYPERGLIGASE